MKSINIIGLGYIGLPTALIIANSGFKVVGTDINEKIIKKLNSGKILTKEDGLKDLYSSAIKNDIKFTINYVKADIYIVTVPTPYIKKSKKIDASYVISAVERILDVCEDGNIIAIESTISPGTIDKYIRPLVQKRMKEGNIEVHLAHVPERIIPGKILYELKNNARTIGVDKEEIGEELKDLYGSFCKGELSITSIKIAEMTKVVENTFRDINIAFSNELIKICKKEDLDVYEVINIANKHPRVNILKPGPGVGGHCISVDPWFLVGDFKEEAKLILAAREINDSMPEYVKMRIEEIMNLNNINDIDKIGLYGLSYKANVDDIRESPSIALKNLLEKKYKSTVKVYDPMISKRKIKGQYLDFMEFVESVEFIVILVDHKHLISNINCLDGKLILDTKNIVEIKEGYKL